MMIAAAKTGNKLLLSSPRNSVEGHISLTKESGCEFWFTASGTDNDGFIKQLQIPSAEVPDLPDLLSSTVVPLYPYEKQFHEGYSDVLALLHTSGSTGLPKLVPLYLGTAATIDAFHVMEPIDGKMPNPVEWAGTRMLCAMPLFHVAGICLGLFSAVFFRWTVILPSTGPLMQHLIEDSLDNITVDSAFISPSVLQDISKSPRILEKLSKLRFITTAGGPVAQSVGNSIHSRVPIYQTMGMTEGQWLASVVTHPDDWQYYRFHPRTGFEMRPYSDTLFELVFVKRENLASTQPVFVTFPDLDTWESRDLYSRHPTISGLWKYEMRADDLIVLSNGEKFNPLAAEGVLISHPWISSAYITGRGRFQAAALLYPIADLKASDLDIIDNVWPTIEHVNTILPGFAQIHRDFVTIVRSPFPRTPKGTLSRNDTEKEFTKEIEDMYRLPSDCQPSVIIDEASQESIRAGIRDAIRVVSNVAEIDDDDNIFSKGFDSLHAIRLERLLKASFAQRINVKANTIYLHPSIKQLSEAVWILLHQEKLSRSQDSTSNGLITSQMVSKYLNSFEKGRKELEYIVITGTTGSIGPYLLDIFSKSGQVGGIWCLNRSENAQEKQVELAKVKGLSQDWDGKVKFAQCDLSSEALGLSHTVLQEIKDRATTIIHNAWEVNFNLPLAAFEPHFIGLRELVNICQNTRNKVRFYFTSSISSAMNWSSNKSGPVPEAEISNFDAPINGYGASKLVAEHLLHTAAKAGGLNFSSLRVGQVAGPVQTLGNGGAWTRRDWLPALIDASAYLKMLPSDLGSATNLDWIPVDLLAEIIGQLVVRPILGTRAPEMYYNILNPRKSCWSDVLSIIRGRLETAMSENIQVVPFQEWINCLRDADASIIREADTGSSETARKAQTGLMLISFFQNLADKGSSPDVGAYAGIQHLDWAMSNSLSQSTILANLAPVSEAWFDAWLQQWGY
ncbi:hypothetical protein JX265_003264 [Neoarthrinium moseri]|uniref:Carrier domain-containing protein n=1 Tax=Neoarthrinium moseri TaxID=1658444 RepID=A0A9Q0ATX6_9PEZI|nr:hypothetical protein JX265_003264 [Neoarthrinium moseri]